MDTLLTMDPNYRTHKILNGSWSSSDASLTAEIRDFDLHISNNGSEASGRFSFTPVMMGMPMIQERYDDDPVIAVGPDISLYDNEMKVTVTGMSLRGEDLEVVLTDENRCETVCLLFKENKDD